MKKILIIPLKSKSFLSTTLLILYSVHYCIDQKNDTLSTHQVLLRLALFGMNAIEDNNARCILLVQVIGKLNPKSILYFLYCVHKCIYVRRGYNILWMYRSHKWPPNYFRNFKNQNPIIYARLTRIHHET